ncbi:inorganic phosphate transporter [Bacillus carboniphilus]|uniref:Inorganic phosphate transporter n=1 Tax=Bacillus carboniphilus TaxID=86663 RepID=A0ABY9K118_9BACI|nr:inorganic phosphate transporter [Bacillus carboniphilus]WLR43591.1 inorganic phosphate transporter [Bacillus carboniphilus]
MLFYSEKKVLETNGKRIVEFSKLQGLLVSLTGGSLVLICSLFGVPIPMTQITTSSLIGLGASKEGSDVFKKKIVRQVFRVWLLSPFFSFVLSFIIFQAWINSYHLLWVILLLPLIWILWKRALKILKR